MDPAFKEVVVYGLWSLVIVVSTIAGSATLVLRLLKGTITELKDENTGIRKSLADCEKRHDDTDDKFRDLANNCPITQQPCPLQSLFRRRAAT